MIRIIPKLDPVMETLFGPEPVLCCRSFWAAPFLPVVMGKLSYCVVFKSSIQKRRVTPAITFFIGS
jgi:hypothetical protein